LARVVPRQETTETRSWCRSWSWCWSAWSYPPLVVLVEQELGWWPLVEELGHLERMPLVELVEEQLGSMQLVDMVERELVELQ